MVLSRCGVVQFLRDAVSIFSFLSGERRTEKAGASAGGRVRGFWFSQISIQEEKAAAELSNKRPWDGGCCLPWLASRWCGGCRMKSSEHTVFSPPSFTNTCEMLSYQISFQDEEPWSFALQNLSGRIWNIATTNLWQSWLLAFFFFFFEVRQYST